MSFRCLVLLLAGLLAACATSSAGTPGTATEVAHSTALAAPDTMSPTGSYTGVSDYRLGAQDLLEVNVFQVPDLNRTVRLNSAGEISLPLVGVVRAGGLTVQELEKVIAGKLSATYLQDPQVSVFVKEYTSQRITIEGSVVKPGIYPLTGRTTLLQAIAMGGGLDNYADLRGVIVFRQVEGRKMRAVFDIKAIRAGTVEDPQVYGDDIVVVEKSGSKSAMRRVIEALPVFNLFLLY